MSDQRKVAAERSNVLAHVGSMQQAAYVRPIEYQEAAPTV